MLGTFCFQKFVVIPQQCFALLPQVNFPTNNLNFHRSWLDQIQAIFLNIFYFIYFLSKFRPPYKLKCCGSLFIQLNLEFFFLSFSVSTLWWCLEKGGIRGVWCFDSIFERIQENQLWQTSFFQWEIRQKQVEKSQIGKCAKTRFTFNLDERKTPWQDFETYSGI